MSLPLCCVTEERHYLGIMIIISSPSINLIPTAHCVYKFSVVLFLYFLLLPVFTVQGELLESTFVSPSSHDIVLLMAAHSTLHLKEPAQEIMICSFGCCCLFFSLLASAVKSNSFGVRAFSPCFVCVRLFNSTNY